MGESVDPIEIMQAALEAAHAVGITFYHKDKPWVGQIGPVEEYDLLEYGGNQVGRKFELLVMTVQFGTDPRPVQNDPITINGIVYRIHKDKILANPNYEEILYEIHQAP